jgi:monoamine oxidase
MGGTWFSREHQPALAAEIARYGLEVNARTPIEQTVIVTSEGRTQIAGSGLALTSVLSPTLPALDAAVKRLRSAWDQDLGTPPDLDVDSASWIEALDAPRNAKDLLLGWMASMGGGSPSKQSIITMLGDAAATGYDVAEVFDSISESLANGTGALVSAIAADAGRAGADLRTGAVVRRVIAGDNEVRVHGEDGLEERAHVAIVALPINCWNDVEFEPAFSKTKQDASERGHVGDATKVLALTKDFPNRTGGMGWTTKFQGLIGMRPEGTGTLIAGFDGLRSFSDPTDPLEVQGAIREFVPGATVVATDSHNWNEDPFSKGAWISWPPGWIDIEEELRRPEGRIIPAGSDIAEDGGGYIEGAISSGLAAAAAASRAMTLAGTE